MEQKDVVFKGVGFNVPYVKSLTVDAFVLHFLDNLNFFPAVKAPADREALLRQAYAAITGQPAETPTPPKPTPAEPPAGGGHQHE